MRRFVQELPLLEQMRSQNLEFDQMLLRALQVSASQPNLHPEDVGFPDSYITLALYRLNTILTRLVDLDKRRYNIFHEYKLAPPCPVDQIKPGMRLCGVLDKAAELAAPKQTIGVGHFLKAIVTLTLDEPAEEWYGATIHNTFSAETLLWSLGHTAWTDVSKAPELRHILSVLAGREPTEDVQYLMTSEEDRIVFRPMSVLDTYRMEDDKGTQATRIALLTHFKDQYASVTPSEIVELESLINDPTVKEQDIQEFFEAHSQFFRMWDHRDVYPHVYLAREDMGPLVPDFILVDPELQKAMLLDFKLPQKKIITRKPNRVRFASSIDEARAQLHEYRDWFENPRNRARLKDKLGMEVYRPRMGVIIGTNQEFRNTVERQKIRSRHEDIEVVTYDDIIAHAKRRLLIVRGAARQ